MDYYPYSRVTGEYQGAPVAARQDPLDPSRYVIPRFALWIAPPATGANEVAACLDHESWTVVPDFRGQTIHHVASGEERDCGELGPLPEGWAAGPAPVDYARVRAAQVALIESERSRAEHAGFVFEHAGSQWDGGLMSKQRLRETIDGFNAAGGLPPGFFWTDANNNDVEMIALADLEGLFDAMSVEMVQRGFAIHAQQRALKQQISEAPDDIEAITAITWQS